jgi:hypothetical protein
MGGMLITLRGPALFLGKSDPQNCTGFTHGTPTCTLSPSVSPAFDSSNGLYFVGIDISWAGDWDLTRNYGLAIDNLLAADVVLAYGRLVTADERHHEDLFWALRGGNFGIVTSFVFKDMPDRCCGKWNSHTRSRPC